MPLRLSNLQTSWLLLAKLWGIAVFAAFAFFAFASFFLDTKPAAAQDTPACEQFNWPVKREQAAFAATDLRVVPSGATLDALPERGIILALKPNTQVTFALPPERQPKNAESSAGVIAISNVPKAGSYQVTTSAEGWIDAVQNGKAVAATAHTGRRDCADVRKSVRFDLQPGTVTIQLSGVDSKSVKVAVLPVQ
jgi:hypothetical protein